MQGIFRGSGRQSLAAIYNFCAYYILGIPLGYVLGIKLGFGVEGLWWGMTAGLCAIAIGTWDDHILLLCLWLFEAKLVNQSTGCTIIVRRSDWKKLALDATERLNA